MSLIGCTTGSAPHANGPATSAPSATRAVTTLGVLGDSISLGVNACEQPGECPAVSWVMGTDSSVESLATRIGRQTGRRPAIANGAVSGGTVATLLQSVHAVVAAKPQLVTILIGANDACQPSAASMTGVAEFEHDYGRVLGIVLDALPDARVLALSVPDLYRLWELEQASATASEVWSESGACGALLSGSGTASAADAERQAVRQRVEDYNRSIARLCSARPRCISDGGAVHAQRFTMAELSDIDYFHPSRQGQKKIARLAWAALERAS